MRQAAFFGLATRDKRMKCSSSSILSHPFQTSHFAILLQMKKTISDLLSQYAKSTWARLSGFRSGKNQSIALGLRVTDGQITRHQVHLANTRRATHIAV